MLFCIFFQHLVSNVLIRGEAIRTELISPSIFAVPSFPQVLKEIDSQHVKELFLACHTRCEEIHGIWLVSPVPAEFMALSIKLSERVTVTDCKW